MITQRKQRRIEYPVRYYPRLSNRNDQAFLTQILAQKAPIIQGFNDVASFILDDHPYPRNADEFRRRTVEINREIRHLHLSLAAQRFLDRLMTETGVSVVRIIHFFLFFLQKNISDLGRSLARFSYNRC